MPGLSIYQAQILVAQATDLAQLPEEELQAKARIAAAGQDLEALWALTEAYLLLKGKRGRRVSQHTLRNYRRGLVQFLVWAGEKEVKLLTPRPNMGESYVRWLEQGYVPDNSRSRVRQEGRLQRSTVQTHLSSVRNLYAALRWAGATESTPFADVRPSPDGIPKHLKRKAYSDEAVELLISQAEADKDLEALVIVLLAAHSGLRNFEIGTLRRSDLHLDVPTEEVPYAVVTGKGDRREEVELSRRTEDALRRYLAYLPYGELLLPHTTSAHLSRKLRALAARAGVEYKDRQLHGLRHSAGTRTYMQAGDLGAVQQKLRHKDPSSSAIYIDYAAARKRGFNRDW